MLFPIFSDCLCNILGRSELLKTIFSGYFSFGRHNFLALSFHIIGKLFKFIFQLLDFIQ